MTTTAPTTEPVSFASDSAELRGELFLPAAGDGNGGLPAVVVTGTWTSVRQQMADRYARQLAERGYAALSFDFTGFGGSDGEPRDVESPSQKARDIHHAVGFLAEHTRIDPRRVGALGVCASAGYTALNAIDDGRVRALALIAPWLHDAALVREMYGGEQGVAERIEAGRAARERYQQTRAVDYVPAQSATDPSAAMPMAVDFYENPERGAIDAWPNRFAVMAWPEWLAFDAIALASRLRTPTLIVHSEDGAIPDGARRFHAALGADKAIAWTAGTQFDFYDQPSTVADAADRAAAHLGRYLQ
ncbi:MAG: alpha/beta hydrolase [Thermoleophilaceae bacterium]